MVTNFTETGYILDPHTAVASRALQLYRARYHSSAPGILVSTAHPAKFTAVVRKAINGIPPIPSQLERTLNKAELLVPLPNSYEALTERLLDSI
jgi:threonine synthase